MNDENGKARTPLVHEKMCAYAIRDNKGISQCRIEKAYHDGAIKFQKPISCHLYPIRISDSGQATLVNYHKWHICSNACTLGKTLGMPIYQFVKDALIRRFGKQWYSSLVEVIKNRTTPDAPAA